MREIKKALNILLKSLFPEHCRLCGEVVELGESLCSECENLPEIKGEVCPFCAAKKEDCFCKKHKNEYKAIVAPYYYKDQLVTIVHNFKMRRMPFLAEGLAEKMYDCVSERYSDISFDFICYVPFTRLHLMKRGYNQSELLADELSRLMKIAVRPALIKTRNTGVQHKKTASQRKADVFGSYDVDDKFKTMLDGKTILLVDDVKTTGSTLNECAKMLNIYGAKAVYCVALAVTNNKKSK